MIILGTLTIILGTFTIIFPLTPDSSSPILPSPDVAFLVLFLQALKRFRGAESVCAWRLVPMGGMMTRLLDLVGGDGDWGVLGVRGDWERDIDPARRVGDGGRGVDGEGGRGVEPMGGAGGGEVEGDGE